MFLAGDVGGTTTRLGIYSHEGNFFCVEAFATYESASFSSLEEVIKLFLAENPHKISALCLGVPGTVHSGQVELTNLPWEFSEKGLHDALSMPGGIRIVNDLYAVAAALPHLTDADYVTVHPGGDIYGNNMISVLAPGTGLGHASAMRHTDGWWQVFYSEGGHLDFAPRDPLSIKLLEFLYQKYNDHVSYERVLSGPGIENIYTFLGTLPEHREEEAIVGDDLARSIAEYGLAGESKRAVKTLDIFARILGGFAGNCALYNHASGGIFIGGGIPPKLLDKLLDGVMLEEYLRQGRMSTIVEDTPLRIITNDRVGLLGAAVLGRDLLSRMSDYT